MAQITCEYCGTEYDATLQRCPLCGTLNESAAEEPEEIKQPRSRRERKPAKKRRHGAREAQDSDRIPKWITVLICIILGLAVVLGALYALYALGVFTPKSVDDDRETDLTLPIDGDTQGDTQEPSDSQEPEDFGTTETVACEGITLSPPSVQLSAAGVKTTLYALLEPTNTTETVRWTSSDPSVCTVDQKGIVTAVADGTATITAACGSFTATVEVECDFGTTAENDAILSVTDFTLFSTGEQATIEVRNAPEDAEITWTTSNSGVCTVEDGVVTAVKAGTATVTADVNGKELECIVRCSIEGSVIATPGNAETASGSQLDHTDVTLNVGDSFEISVVNGVSGGWNVSDPSIISVDALGIVKGLAQGTATVYTTVGGQRLECIVRVR